MRLRRRFQYDGFFINAPLAAFVFDRDGCVLRWNPAAEATFGWKQSEVVGQPLPIVPPAAREEFRKLRQRVLDGENVTGVEAIRQRKDGTQIAVRISAAPYRDASHHVVGVLAMVEDLSVRRALERSVADTARLLAGLVEASPVAMIMTDAESRIRIWNAAAAEMYGWTAAEVVGRPVDVIASTAAGRLLTQLPERGPIAPTPARVADRRRDGTEFVAWPVGAVIRGEERPLATIVMVRDVTMQVEAERAAGQATEELRALSLRAMNALEEERLRISREIHDDLGQLLTGVTFELATVKGALRDEAAAARLDHATRAIERALETVRRIAADLRPPLLDAVGLSAAIQMEVATFQERTGIECNLSLPDQPLHDHGEVAVAVYRVLQEALTNVARHAGARTVDVRLRERDGMLYMEVRDDGRGIATTAKRAGGLGLIGMRERAGSVGGELRIEPGRPHGTVVTLAVPLGETG
ncbi:MAG TPA: PAS domain S-box protein [Thermoanaerobaculia bacterium]|jgi:PAS domain S-box-containing protein